MKGAFLLRNVSLYTRNCLLRTPSNAKTHPSSSFIIPPAASAQSRLSFYSSCRSFSSGIHDNEGAAADDVTGKELKKRVEKFLDGDDEAIPSIFEAILERKLAKLQGKHGDEKDEELIEELCGKREDLRSDYEDEDSDSGDDSDDF